MAGRALGLGGPRGPDDIPFTEEASNVTINGRRFKAIIRGSKENGISAEDYRHFHAAIDKISERVDEIAFSQIQQLRVTPLTVEAMDFDAGVYSPNQNPDLDLLPFALFEDAYFASRGISIDSIEIIHDDLAVSAWACAPAEHQAVQREILALPAPLEGTLLMFAEELHSQGLSLHPIRPLYPSLTAFAQELIQMVGRERLLSPGAPSWRMGIYEGIRAYAVHVGRYLAEHATGTLNYPSAVPLDEASKLMTCYNKALYTQICLDQLSGDFPAMTPEGFVRLRANPGAPMYANILHIACGHLLSCFDLEGHADLHGDSTFWPLCFRPQDILSAIEASMTTFIAANYNPVVGFAPGSLGVFVTLDLAIPVLGPGLNVHNYRVAFALHQIWDAATAQNVYELRSFFPRRGPGLLRIANADLGTIRGRL